MRQGSEVVGLIVLCVLVLGGELSIAQGGGDLEDRGRRGWWPVMGRR